MTAESRHLSLYDGQELAGRIVVGENGEAVAFDRGGKRIGVFVNFRAAAAAIPSIEPAERRQ
jgi:hypothetical protein